MAAGKYLAGVAIALCTTFMSALGLSLQKRAHKEIEKKRLADKNLGQEPKNYKAVKQPKWVLGLCFMAASALLSLAVFALVGQSVASAFASVTIVYNMILSYLFLHERITRLDIAIASLMIAGTILAVVFGSRGSTSSFLTLDNILDIWTRPAAIVGFVLFGLLVIAMGCYIVWFDRTFEKRGISKSSSTFRLTMLMRCATAGLFSGFVGTFSKAVVSVFSASVGGSVSDNLHRWEVWVFLLLLPTALVFQVIFLNSALKRFDATEAVPLYQSMVVICGVIFGWTIFNESAGKTGGDIAGFIAGICLIVIGILCLMLKRQTRLATLSTMEVVQALVEQNVLRKQLLRRTHSAPPSLRPRAAPRKEARTCQTAACRGMNALRITVPLHYIQGTGVTNVYAVLQDCNELVSPSFLIGRRRPCGTEPETMAIDMRAMPASLRVHTLLPTSYRMMTERNHDVRLRASYAVAQHAIPLSDKELKEKAEKAHSMQGYEIGPLPFFGPSTQPAQSPSITQEEQMMTSLRRLLTLSPRRLKRSYEELSDLPPQPDTIAVPNRSHRPLATRAFFSHDGTLQHVDGQLEQKVTPITATPALPTEPATAQGPVAGHTHARSALALLPTPQFPQNAGAPSNSPPGEAAALMATEAAAASEPENVKKQEPSVLIIPLALVQSVPFDCDVVQAVVRARNLQGLLPEHGRKRRLKKKLKRLTSHRSTASAPKSTTESSSHYVAESKTAVHVHEVNANMQPGGGGTGMLTAAASTITTTKVDIE